MPSYLVSTEVLVTHLLDGAESVVLGARRLNDVAVSALTFEAIAAEAETSRDLDPLSRVRWRTNLVRFREQLVRSGGEVTIIGRDVIEQWGRLQVVTLCHGVDDGSPVDLSTEERLVVATALARGLIYINHERDYNQSLQDRFGLAIEVV